MIKSKFVKSMVALLTVGCISLLATGCGNKEEETTAPPAPPAPAASKAPVTQGLSSAGGATQAVPVPVPAQPADASQ